MSHTVKIALSTLGLVLGVAVLLHSLHATQVLGLAAVADGKLDIKKLLHDDTRPDLHNHHDKQPASSLLKTFNGDAANLVDGRSHRLLHKRRGVHALWNFAGLREWLRTGPHHLLI